MCQYKYKPTLVQEDGVCLTIHDHKIAYQQAFEKLPAQDQEIILYAATHVRDTIQNPLSTSGAIELLACLGIFLNKLDVREGANDTQ